MGWAELIKHRDNFTLLASAGELTIMGAHPRTMKLDNSTVL
jgi:hypothetical protein